MAESKRPDGVSGGIGSNIVDELRRFNEERSRLLGGRPIEPGKRMPLPFTGKGGDIPENA